MPTPIWQCSIDYLPSFSTGTANPDLLAQDWTIAFRTICQPLADPRPQFNPTVDFGHFTVALTRVTSSGQSAMVIGFQLGVSDIDDHFWSSSFDFPGVFGTLAQFDGGGTITITKDYDANTLTAVSPIGTISGPLNGAGLGAAGYQNNVPLRLQGYRLESQTQTTFAWPPYNADREVKWSQMVGRQNGVAYETIALSAADPGAFWPPLLLRIDQNTSQQFLNEPQWWTYVQDALDQEQRWDVTVADSPADSGAGHVYVWIRDLMVPAGLSVDLTDEIAHNRVWAAWTSDAAVDQITVRRTERDGALWSDQVAVSGSDVLQSVTINEVGGRLFLLYDDMTTHAVMQSVSQDAGLTWSTAVPIAITGTNPRLVVDKTSSAFFYFFLTGGNLVLQRSFDQGQTLFDAMPITVATSVPVQEFGAVMAPDHGLVVAFVDAGMAWHTRLSRDFGLTWSNA